MSDENASKTLRVSPAGNVSQGSGAGLPDPASTQAAPALGMQQEQKGSDELRDLAQKTVKLAPPTRTGFQRPSPMPAAVPKTAPQPAVSQASTIKLHAAFSAPSAANVPKAPAEPAAVDQPQQNQVRTIARQTIKLAPPTRTGFQRPTPAASATPVSAGVPSGTPALGTGSKSVAKAPTLNLDFAALKAGAKRTQTVNVPFAEKVPMSSEESKSGQESTNPPLPAAGAPTLSESAGMPESKGPTIQLKSPAVSFKKTVSAPEPVVPAAHPESASGSDDPDSRPSPKGPTIQLKKISAANGDNAEAASVKAPGLQLKKTVSSEANSNGSEPSPKGPTIQLKKSAADGEVELSTPTPKVAASQADVPDVPAADADDKASLKNTTAGIESSPSEENDSANKQDIPLEEIPENEETESNVSDAEPGIVFTILSAVSLIVLLLSVYILLAQYSAIWLDGFRLPFPGLK